MKSQFALASLIFAPLTLVGSGGLTWTCVDGTLDNGNCYPGHVHFTGAPYASTIHINVVRNGDGTVYDDFDYDASGGVDFTEVLYPAGSYTVTLAGYPYAGSKNISTGSDGN